MTITIQLEYRVRNSNSN